MKKIWIILALLVLVGCGSKQQCPRCSQAVDFGKDVFCSNCGMTFTGIKPDGYEETPVKSALGTWRFLIPDDDYGENLYDAAHEVFLTIQPHGHYYWEFGRLIVEKNSTAYQEILEDYGSEQAAEKAMAEEWNELSKEIEEDVLLYNIVHDKNDLLQEFEDIYYDEAADELWIVFDAGYIFSGTRK